jgi:hypothetical protein
MSPEDRQRFFPEAGFKPALPLVPPAKDEKQLQGQLESLLKRNGIIPVRQRMDRHSNIAVGLPDIMFSCLGRACFWEVKMPGKSPTADQQKMLDDLARHPMCAHVRVIRTYSEAVIELHALMSLPPFKPNKPEVPA